MMMMAINRDDFHERRYLVQFAFRHVNFWLPELDSLLKMQGLDPKGVYSRADFNFESPFLRLTLPTEEHARKLASRAILVLRVVDLWGSGKDYAELVAAVDAAPATWKEPWFAETVPWNLSVDGFNRSFSMPEQQERRMRFKHLPFLGKVQLKGADATRFWLIENYGKRDDGAPQAQEEPLEIFFGRQVGLGRRDLVARYDLKRRSFLGPTSMDNELAFIMANMARVRPGSLVCDPFVGTGSLLVPCTVFGARCVGTDIDVRILRGKGGRNIATMFRSYGLPVPELLRLDFSPRGRCVREPRAGLFDARRPRQLCFTTPFSHYSSDSVRMSPHILSPILTCYP